MMGQANHLKLRDTANNISDAWVDETTGVNVLIVEDSSTICMAIRLALSLDPKINVVGCAASAAEALQLIRVHAVDVVTLDLNLSDMCGLALIDLVVAAGECAVVVISGTGDEHIAAKARGVADAFGKTDLLDQREALIQSIHKAAAHQRILRGGTGSAERR